VSDYAEAKGIRKKSILDTMTGIMHGLKTMLTAKVIDFTND
jgi:hypothetical protein